MKRTLINALSVATVALGGTQLSAQESPPAPKTYYQICMDYCMAEGWGFHHCNADCAYLAES